MPNKNLPAIDSPIIYEMQGTINLNIIINKVNNINFNNIKFIEQNYNIKKIWYDSLLDKLWKKMQ